MNPHPFRDWILSPARLPIPPLSQRVTQWQFLAYRLYRQVPEQLVAARYAPNTQTYLCAHSNEYGKDEIRSSSESASSCVAGRTNFHNDGLRNLLFKQLIRQIQKFYRDRYQIDRPKTHRNLTTTHPSQVLSPCNVSACYRVALKTCLA